MTGPGRFLGKSRGTVINNVDPDQRGRIMAMVPDVSNVVPASWALPCLPVATFGVPPIGASVWIEFEYGDPNHPIWVGCFYGSAADVPGDAPTVPPAGGGIALQTVQGNGLVISDVPGPAGGIMIRSASGATIVVNDDGISIQNGTGASIVMAGPTVTVNGGALEII